MSELLVNGKPIAYDKMPTQHMANGFRLYFEQGILPGSFGTALLENDFMGACRQADYINKLFLFEWASWLCNHAPAGSYGSPAHVAQWIKSRQPRPTAE